MIPPYDIGPPNCYFLGLPMSQNRYAVPAWSYAFEQLPPARIIEIGTGDGGFTSLLGIYAAAYGNGTFVYTIDIERKPKAIDYTSRFSETEIDDKIGDVFEPSTESGLKKLIACPETSYVLCDGGNKFREFQTFAPFLKPGDVIGVHDLKSDAWPFSEITEEQVEPLSKELNLQPWLPDIFANTGWLVRRKT